MEYIRYISPKSLLLALTAGYLIPYLVIRLISKMLAPIEDSVISSYLGFFVILWFFIIAPLMAGYIGAKYSEKTHLFNGLLATIAGLTLYLIHGTFTHYMFYLGFILVSLPLGYVGANRYIKHG